MPVLKEVKNEKKEKLVKSQDNKNNVKKAYVKEEKVIIADKNNYKKGFYLDEEVKKLKDYSAKEVQKTNLYKDKELERVKVKMGKKYQNEYNKYF